MIKYIETKVKLEELCDSIETISVRLPIGNTAELEVHTKASNAVTAAFEAKGAFLEICLNTDYRKIDRVDLVSKSISLEEVLVNLHREMEDNEANLASFAKLTSSVKEAKDFLDYYEEEHGLASISLES